MASRWIRPGVRFSLRTLLLVVTGVCVMASYVGTVYHRARVRDSVANRVESLGGTVRFGDEMIETSPELAHAFCVSTPFSAHFLGRDATREIVVIRLTGCQCLTEDDVRAIGNMSSLRCLGFSNTNVADDDLCSVSTQMAQSGG